MNYVLPPAFGLPPVDPTIDVTIDASIPAVVLAIATLAAGVGILLAGLRRRARTCAAAAREPVTLALVGCEPPASDA